MKKWEMVKITDIFEFQKKSKTKAGDGLEKGKYPFFTSSEILSKNLDTYHFDKSSLIFGTGGKASVHFCDKPFAVSTDCFVVQTIDSNRIFTKYVYYYFISHIYILEEGFKGAGLKHISKEYLSNIQIPLPPIETQKRISEILDKADALRRKDLELLEKYDQLAQSIFIDMFGDPIKNDKGWEIKKLGDVCVFPSGLINPIEKPYCDLFHVGGDNIESGTGNLFGLKKANKLNLISGKFYFTSKHILYNKIRPYLNKVAVPDFDGICSADMYPILPKKNIISKEYLYNILKNPIFLEFAEKQSRRANIPKINMKEMSTFEFPIPPIEKQMDYDEKEKYLTKIKLQLKTTIKLSESLFQSLLQRAFKGELA